MERDHLTYFKLVMGLDCGVDKSVCQFGYPENCINGGRKMVGEADNESCCLPTDRGTGCCKVESVISVDERGQMVLPKEIREKANIRPGDKLAITSWEKDGKVCCISLIRAEELAEMVKGMLGPVIKEVL